MARDIGKTDAYVVSRRQRKRRLRDAVRAAGSDPERLVCFREVRQASGMTAMGAKRPKANANSGRKVTVRFGPGDRESCRSLSVKRSGVFRLDPPVQSDQIEPKPETTERALAFHCNALGLRIQKAQQIGIDRLRLGRDHAVGEIFVGLQRCVFQQFGA